jgi:hypothetical protein
MYVVDGLAGSSEWGHEAAKRGGDESKHARAGGAGWRGRDRARLRLTLSVAAAAVQQDLSGGRGGKGRERSRRKHGDRGATQLRDTVRTQGVVHALPLRQPAAPGSRSNRHM